MTPVVSHVVVGVPTYRSPSLVLIVVTMKAEGIFGFLSSSSTGRSSQRGYYLGPAQEAYIAINSHILEIW